MKYNFKVSYTVKDLEKGSSSYGYVLDYTKKFNDMYDVIKFIKNIKSNRNDVYQIIGSPTVEGI